MTVKSVREMVNAIEKAGIKRYTIWCNNAYIVEVGSDSTRIIYDDANARFFYLRIPNSVSPGNNSPIVIECEEYELIERICVGGQQPKVLEVFNTLGLKATDDLTQWLKTAGSQSGLYPVQSNPRYNDDDDRKPINHNFPYRPTITTN